ncbi:amino acid/amide ABC transporter substrate-binding protein (HAAT family) [Rhizobium subbaraonis]|uniref:Amino acid/amide ABC transporter substrate-binding protein (HAAT family) n=1 Tax=Rhizobium subbaraonis TaxID=908946 RepID=A0A285UWZ9_9HYPH|nr:branched-chain amino acid ABC transporter substrate-binding protein [Rhizobium subbaraonis]SOC46414.1 amino acid/amide ABC transporter substrate-binding protein (HAAT family) [Rhizobium subbaraonis]
MKFAASLCLGVSLLASHALADEVTIGLAGPLSGPQAYFGSTWHNGFKLYVDQLNAAGGVNGTTIAIDQQDDKADPREGTLVAQKYCDNDDVVLGLVNFNSGVAQSTLPIYEDCSLPTMTFGSNPALTQQGYKFMVRPVANDLAGALLPAEYALGELGAKKAIVVNDKQVFGQGISEIFANNFTTGGGELLDTLAIAPTDVDFTAVLAQIKSKSPDVIYLGAVMPQLALFAKQMHEQGVTATLLVPDGGYTPDFISQAGEANVQGAIVAIQVPPMDASPDIAAFGKLYKEKYGEEAGPYSIYGYVQAQILEEVLKTTKGFSREEMNDALHAVKVKTAVGELEFDEVGELKVAPSYLYKVEGKDFMMIGSK